MDKNRTLDLHVSGLTSPLIAPIVDIAIHIRRSTKFLLLLRGHRVQSTTITVIVHRSRSGLSSSIALGFVSFDTPASFQRRIDLLAAHMTR